MPAVNKLPFVLCALALLGGCATDPEYSRPLLAAPAPVSAVYSEMNMQIALVTTADVSLRCPQPGCAAPEPFEQRVAWIGSELAKAAYELFPDLAQRIKGFEFTVAEKAEPGTLSSSTGRIIVLKPVSSFSPNDVTLGYIVGRELGHVIAKHHEENTAVSLIVSGVVQLVLPAANIARIFTNVFLAGTASTSALANIAAGASLTATSFVGSRLLITSYKPVQRDEADAIALKLLAHLGFDPTAVSAAFASVDLKSPATDWMSDLRVSVERLAPPRMLGHHILVDSRGGVPPRLD